MKENNARVFVDINNAHGDEMKVTLQKIIDEGIDPFSLEHMSTHHKKPILKVGKYWYVTENQWPYPNTKHHFMIVAKEYAESLADMEPEAGAELFMLSDELIQKHDIQGGALCMRFGETSATGATVKRLHAQLIVSDTEQGNVLFPIGRKKRE